MENYVKYLENLQKEMKLDEKVDYDKLEEYGKLRSKYNNLASLFGVIGIALALSMIFLAPYLGVGLLLPLILALFTGGLMADFGGKSEYCLELLRKERDKVYNLNYSNIKSIIINDGDEHLKQLATWWRMCELSTEDKDKYAELLRIVSDVCREYVVLWR